MADLIFRRSQTIELYAEVKDSDGEFVDPTSIVVTVKEPDGTVKVDAQAMTKSDTGKYVYYYTLDSDATYGWWLAYITITDGSGGEAKITIVSDQFRVGEIK